MKVYCQTSPSDNCITHIIAKNDNQDGIDNPGLASQRYQVFINEKKLKAYLTELIEKKLKANDSCHRDSPLYHKGKSSKQWNSPQECENKITLLALQEALLAKNKDKAWLTILQDARLKHKVADIHLSNERLVFIFVASDSDHQKLIDIDRSVTSNKQELINYLKDNHHEKQKLYELQAYCDWPLTPADCLTWGIAGANGGEQNITDDPLAQKDYAKNPALDRYRALVAESKFASHFAKVLKAKLEKAGNCLSSHANYKKGVKDKLWSSPSRCKNRAGFNALEEILIHTDKDREWEATFLSLRFKHKIAGIYLVEQDIFIVFFAQ